MGENGLFLSLLMWKVFSFCVWGSVEGTCDHWQDHLKHLGGKGPDLNSGICSGCQWLRSWSQVKPWVFQNLQGLSATLKPKSSHQQLAFFLPPESWKAGSWVIFFLSGASPQPRVGWLGSLWESSLWVHLSQKSSALLGQCPVAFSVLGSLFGYLWLGLLFSLRWLWLLLWLTLLWELLL